MKIDNDMRQAIKAAHKHQPEATTAARNQARQAAVDKFLAERPVFKRKVTQLVKEEVRLRTKLESTRDKLKELLEPIGLDSYEGRVYLDRYNRHSREERFTQAGGDLSALTKMEWDVDAVIAELAAADPKDATKILAKYGIRWE